MNIGFIGLGAMGAGIARNLLKNGHTVTVWNRSADAVAAIVKDGSHPAARPEDTLKGEIVFSILANDTALEDIGFDGPLLKAAAPGLVHVNMATISLPLAQKLASVHAAMKVGYVACPVFGRPDAAAGAKLLLIAAGAPDLIEKVRPVLEPLGRRLFVVGEKPEQANLVKITGNFMIAAAIEAYGEAFALLRKGGVAPQTFLDAMNEGLFAGAIHKLYGGIIAEGTYDPPGFKLRLGYKDAGLTQAAAKLLEAPMPLASLIHDHFLEAMAAGRGDKDWAMLGALAAKRAGL
jgi:3-hydroxyisobutyrate dehydrogenase-like beta-hydroxyacid dehydrogenase